MFQIPRLIQLSLDLVIFGFFKNQNPIQFCRAPNKKEKNPSPFSLLEQQQKQHLETVGETTYHQPSPLVWLVAGPYVRHDVMEKSIGGSNVAWIHARLTSNQPPTTEKQKRINEEMQIYLYNIYIYL